MLVTQVFMSKQKSSANLAISVKNLTKSYRDFKAVDEVSFQVRAGEIYAFLGPNGAGKSTTIKMLTTVLKPNQGEILINGFDPQKQAYKARQSFGIVFQDQSLDEELTAYENMDLHGILYQIPDKERKERIQKMLALVDLTDKKNNLVKTFSGGMRRRLEIARGLLHKPKILFLDEPTLGLDPQTRNQVWSYLIELNKKYQMTIFFTTHYLPEVEKAADYITIIDHGKIVGEGTAKQLIAQTKTTSLEDAYLKITGEHVREEAFSNVDRMRQRVKFRRGNR